MGRRQPTGGMGAQVDAVVGVVEAVRALPYVWPCPPTAAAARGGGVGSCASKHALLAEELRGLGVVCRSVFVLGPLVPSVLGGDDELRDAAGLVEVHECLTVEVPEVGPVVVDVTWDPPLVHRGLPGLLPWDGAGDMPLATGPALAVWAPDRRDVRGAKEALRARLYRPGERARRDQALATMSARFAAWRRDGAT